VPKESTFSTAAAAHNYNRLTPVNVKRNVIEHRAVSEFSDEVVDFDDVRVSGHEENDE
jgi:hypothetical protein